MPAVPGHGGGDGDPSIQSLMRAVLVIPMDVKGEFLADFFFAQRNENTSDAFILHGTDQTLNRASSL